MVVVKPNDMAGLALGLIASTACITVCDALGWESTPGQIAALIVPVFLFGVPMRVAVARLQSRYGWPFYSAFFWLVTVLAMAVFIAGAQTGHASRFDLGIGAVAVFGGAVGFGFGTAYVPIAVHLRALVRAPRVDVDELVLFWGAFYVALAATVAMWLQGLQGDGLTSYVVAAGAVAMFVIAALKTLRRARWLARVTAGREPGWAIVADTDESLPSLGHTLGEPAVLARSGGEGGPFRGAGAVSVARVDRAGGYYVRPVVALLLAFATLGAMAVAVVRRQAAQEHRPFHDDFARGDAAHFENLGSLDGMSVGESAVCAHRSDGSWLCWGSRAGYLVPGEWDAVRTPTPAPILQGEHAVLGESEAWKLHPDRAQLVRRHAAGDSSRVGADDVAFVSFFQFFLRPDGHVTRYGINEAGVEVSLPPASAMSGSTRTICVLGRDGSVSCAKEMGMDMDDWRAIRGLDGQRVDRVVAHGEGGLGRVTQPDGSFRWYAWHEQDAAPQPQWDGFSDLAATDDDLCGLRRDGAVVCAGEPMRERLPAGSAVQLASSWALMCARGKTDVWCWGPL